jgi:uncharacterized protein YndB with AHSA1/START domain
MTSGEIRKTLTIDAPPQVVFRALTDEEELVQWWPYEAKIYPRVGGRFEFRLRGAARGYDVVFVGRVTELVPGKRLAYTWESSARQREQGPPTGLDAQPGTITWTLEELPEGKTRVTMLQTGFNEKFRLVAENGWSYNLRRLAGLCERG